MNSSESTVMFTSECHPKLSGPHVIGFGTAYPYGCWVFGVCLLVTVRLAVFSKRGVEIPTRFRVCPVCSIEHLNNLKKNLYDMLVTVEFCTFIVFPAQEEYIHFNFSLKNHGYFRTFILWLYINVYNNESCYTSKA
jgi:hypothetical protein